MASPLRNETTHPVAGGADAAREDAMELTLRKALKLRKQLETLLAKVELPLAADLSVLVGANREKPLDAIASATEKLKDRKDRLSSLSGILRSLRVAVARANMDANVESLLAEAADLDRRIALERLVAEAAPTPAEEHLTGEMALVHENLRASDRARLYGEASRKVTVPVVPEAMREESKRRLVELRREREAVEDRRVSANAGRTVEIAEEDARILREEGLV